MAMDRGDRLRKPWYGRRPLDGSPVAGTHNTGTALLDYSQMDEPPVGFTAVQNTYVTFTTLHGTEIGPVVVPAGVHVPVRLLSLQMQTGFIIIHYNDPF